MHILKLYVERELSERQALRTGTQAAKAKA
jgi:hypothetical protein